MGAYIDKGNFAFKKILRSKYVDKTAFLAIVNSTIDTEEQNICATRSRRFGKSMMARTLCAYYDKSCDSRELFQGLNISKDPSFEEHLNKYNVLFLDITDFTSRPEFRGHIVMSIQQEIINDVKEAYPNVQYKDNSDLMECLYSVYKQTGERFYFIIDEWDAICREFPERRKFKNSPDDVVPTEMDEYVMFLRRLFKSQMSAEVFVGAYLTGILPMGKLNGESNLNNFYEYSIVYPYKAAGCFGFTSEEVKSLCDKYDMDYDKMEAWYDGYQIGDHYPIFNPYSVMNAINAGKFCGYWASTASYERVASFLSLNYEGLKDDFVKMLAGVSCDVNVDKLRNGLEKMKSKDDVLTALIHLGYLTYNRNDHTCRIPNKETRDVFINAIGDCCSKPFELDAL